jgi:hypothetical protein
MGAWLSAGSELGTLAQPSEMLLMCKDGCVCTRVAPVRLLLLADASLLSCTVCKDSVHYKP